MALVCSSGIPSWVYGPAVAASANSHHGLRHAIRPSYSDTRVYSEASKRRKQASEEGNLPFGGKQLINDEHVFTHTSSILAERNCCGIRKVPCLSLTLSLELDCISSEEIILLRASSSRNLEAKLNTTATYVLSSKNAVVLFHRSRIKELDGNLTRFDAVSEGKEERIKSPGDKSLVLKNTSQFILVWNKSNELKNGSLVTLKKVLNDKLSIDFHEDHEVDSMFIGRVIWNQQNWQG